MHKTVQNLINIQNLIKSKQSVLENNKIIPKIIAVSKTFKLDHILPLIEHGHVDYGENKVQEAVEKWSEIKSNNNKIKLHLIGKLQTNKVKISIKLFDYIHSLDNEKLARKISDEQKKQNLKPKLFIQVNIGNESQKNGIHIKKLGEFYNYCKEQNLNVIGIMCIPPFDEDPEISFLRMNYLKKKFNFKELSMGMSSDYLIAINFNATFLRIGSKIFGQRISKL
jgi:pyridoxal phosphate enzyme (YggS family)